MYMVIKAKVITSLCLRGADANAQTTQGSRPLHVAVDMNQTASVQALIEVCHLHDFHILIQIFFRFFNKDSPCAPYIYSAFT